MISLAPMPKVVVRGAVLFMIGFCVSVLAQAPAFDAVSIKANKNSFPGGGCRGIDTKVETIPEGGGLGAAVGLQFSLSQPGLGRCNLNAPVKHLIGMAYEIPLLKWDERILGGPDWIGGDKYRIDAVAANPGSVREAD